MIKFWNPWSGKAEKVQFTISRYFYNDRLAIEMNRWDEEWNYWVPYCKVTVNIDEEISHAKCGFVDTNNAPFLPDFLIQNGLAEPTGRVGYSGYCMYPEFDFTKLLATEGLCNVEG